MGDQPEQNTETPAVGTKVPATPTPAPTATTAPVTPDTESLTGFIEQLQTAVSTLDYAAMQARMSDPVAVGAWRSEWRTLPPAEMISQFQNDSLPVPQAVQFSGLNEEEISALIGQPAAAMLGPEARVATVLHSTGWGPYANDDALLFVVEEEGGFAWSAFLYTKGRFADANIGTTATPVGLIYRLAGDGVYQIQADGQHRQLLDERTASTPNLYIAPDGRQAAYLTDDNQLWVLNTSTDDEQQ